LAALLSRTSSQTQIGVELGYSQMHVSRVLRRNLAQMREQLAS
jgi:DNA-directed RNA polymerase specialized sigma subunit